MAIFLSFETKPHFIYLCLTSAVLITILHYLCSGILIVNIVNDQLEISFERKPILTFLKESKIQFQQIKKWDHVTHSEGPDSLLIYLNSGKKIRLTFRLLALKNNYEDLISDFKNWIEKEKANNPNNDSNPFNVTEHFYKSNKAKVVGIIFTILFSVDFFLMLIDAFELRKLFAMLLLPIILGGMLYLIQYKMFRKQK